MLETQPEAQQGLYCAIDRSQVELVQNSTTKIVMIPNIYNGLI